MVFVDMKWEWKETSVVIEGIGYFVWCFVWCVRDFVSVCCVCFVAAPVSVQQTFDSCVGEFDSTSDVSNFLGLVIGCEKQEAIENLKCSFCVADRDSCQTCCATLTGECDYHFVIIFDIFVLNWRLYSV